MGVCSFGTSLGYNCYSDNGRIIHIDAEKYPHRWSMPLSEIEFEALKEKENSKG